MKKIIFFALLLGLSSCIVDNSNSSTSMKTITIKVRSTEWKYSDLSNNNYFYAGVAVPEITSTVFEKGEVKAYLVKDRNDSYYARKHALPYVMHKEEYVNDNWVFYTETVDFTYGKRLGRV